MVDFILTQADYLLRIFVAALCGMVIGYEREVRLKMAGIRTHTIISMAAGIMVVISKYGFFDVLPMQGISLVASRLASSLVSALGFLPAGTILNRKNGTSGVTTAAGTWATLGIGMAIGAGMWVLGIGSTLMLLLIQYFFHKQLRIFKDSNAGRITLRLNTEDRIHSEDIAQEIDRALADKKIHVLTTHLNVSDGNTLEVGLEVIFPRTFNTEDILSLMTQHREIISIDT